LDDGPFRLGNEAAADKVLAIDISREGFEWALSHSCPSHFESSVYGSHGRWKAVKAASPVIIQWDPERSLLLKKLDYCAIQIGLSGEAANRYVDQWIMKITDFTTLSREIRRLVDSSHLEDAAKLIPLENVYPISPAIWLTIGASDPGTAPGSKFMGKAHGPNWPKIRDIVP